MTLSLHMGLFSVDECKAIIEESIAYPSGHGSYAPSRETFYLPKDSNGTAELIRAKLSSFLFPHHKLQALMMNEYRVDFILGWHPDSIDVVFVICLQNDMEDSLDFVRKSTHVDGIDIGGLPYYEIQPEFSFKLRPGDTVRWTRHDQSKHLLLHGGQFSAGRKTLVARYLTKDEGRA